MPLPKKRLNRIVNIILRIHAAGQHLFMPAKVLVEHVDEISRAIGAGHLAVAEHVADGEKLFFEEFDAVAGVGFGGVIAVGEVEEVDVPLVRRVMLVEQLLG